MSELARNIIADIRADLNDRSGFDLTSLDEEIEQEIFDKWVSIVDSHLSKETESA